MKEPTLTVLKPEVVFLEDLVEQINTGRLRVPRFQRDFVWKPSDMLHLFDSIRKGYPIGSLLIWDTSSEVQSLEMVGGQRVPKAPGTPVKYLLDGHQRLSTLFGVLRLPAGAPNTSTQQDWRWWIWYDLRDQKFVHLAGREAQPFHFPLRALLRTTDFLSESRKIQREFTDYQDLIEEAERLTQAVKRYKVPVTVIEGGTIDEAVETFSRVNGRGRDMSPDEMVSALTYKEGKQAFNLTERISRILEALRPYGFDTTRREFIFRAIVAVAGRDIYDTGWASVAEDLRPELSEMSDRAESALVKATSFLRHEVFVAGAKVLPYALQMVMLAAFFDRCPLPDDNRKRTLVRWFWTTSTNGWFAGANTSQIKNALEGMGSFASSGDASSLHEMLKYPARPLPKRFDLRNARIRALVVYLATLRPVDQNGNELDIQQLLASEGHRALARVFPRLTGELGASPANRVLAGAAQEPWFRSPPPPLLRETAHAAAMFATLGFPPESIPALEAGDASLFIRTREAHLLEQEKQFLLARGVATTSGGPVTDDATDAEDD